MKEHYTRLFSLKNNLHTEASPVLVLAGALLQENQSGRVLVQLKFRNISSQTIKALKIKINTYDVAKHALPGVDEFSYLDIQIAANDEFGANVPIYLANTTTRSFGVEILQVVYDNGQVFEPHCSCEVQAAAQEVLDGVKQIEEEKIQALKDEDVKRKQANIVPCARLRIISFVALGIVVLSFALAFMSQKIYPNIVLISIHYTTLGRYIVALIAPCISLWAAHMAQEKASVLKVSLLISAVLTILQIAAIVFYVSFDSLSLEKQYELQKIRWLIPYFTNGYSAGYTTKLLWLALTNFATTNAVWVSLLAGISNLLAIIPNMLVCVAQLFSLKKIK